jgi:hypothetical protein
VTKLKGGIIYFGSWFQRCQSMVLAPLIWACDETDHYGGGGAVKQSCSVHVVQEAERKGEKGQGQDKLFKVISPQ